MIVDGNNLVREALRTWLTRAFPDCLFLEAHSGEDAIKLALSHPPDLVLMVLELPRMNGIEATRHMKGRAPQTQVVMLSIQENIQYMTEAYDAGVSCYVSKRNMHNELIPIVTRLLPAHTTNHSRLKGLSRQTQSRNPKRPCEGKPVRSHGCLI